MDTVYEDSIYLYLLEEIELRMRRKMIRRVALFLSQLACSLRDILVMGRFPEEFDVLCRV